jgi:hypothetical protein
LTLWFHPGRQKTGVNLNVEIGPILEPQKHYTLVVSARWLSQQGASLAGDFRKSFATTAPDHSQPDLTAWQIQPPAAGSRAALEVRFPEPLDWALLQSQLTVETAAGAPVSGEMQIGEAEQSWRFQPIGPWEAGGYRLSVGSLLEDLAGNSLARPFEVDLAKPAAARVPERLTREFQIEAAPQAAGR